MAKMLQMCVQNKKTKNLHNKKFNGFLSTTET